MTTKPIVALLLAAATAADAAVIRVRTGGNDADNGSDWAHAKATVTAAIAAAESGDEVWVAAGVYHERIHNRVVGDFSVDIALYGGFAGTESTLAERNVAANASIIDGDALGTVVTIDHTAGPAMRIDGFRIRNGQSGEGGGIAMLGSAATIANNSILGNVADFGGGIAIWGYRNLPPVAQPQLFGNVIQANFAYEGAGGLCIVGASPLVRGNVIRLNGTYERGGGIGIWISESVLIARPIIDGNLILENRSTISSSGSLIGGGGIFATERNLADEPLGGIAAPRVRNNVIAANSAVWMGAGVAIVNSESEASEIVGNTVIANSGSGIAWGNAGPLVANNIVAYNTWGLEEDLGNPYSPTIRNNDVYGNTVHERASDWHQLSDGTGVDGNISADPLLVAYGNHRFHLQPGSPCIDAGADSDTGADWTDLDGAARRAGAHVDIGADESDGAAWPDSPVILHVTSTGNDTSDGLAWNTAKRTVQAASDAASLAGGGEVWVAVGTYAEHLTLAAWVQLYGGFAGTETARLERDPVAHATTLDGSEVPPVVNCGAAGYRVATLDGFRITRGGHYWGPTSVPTPQQPAGLGGGIRCDVSSPVIRGNRIEYNSLGDPFTVPEFAAQGGGIGLLGSHPLIEGNTITGNETVATDGEGGGIYCEWSMPDIIGNTISQNHSPDGPAVKCTLSRPMLRGNVVESNEHYYLPPLYFGSSFGSSAFSVCYEVELYGNVFRNNQAGTGGALWLDQPDRATVAGNVFAGNRAYNRQTGAGGEGGAILVLAAANPPGDVLVVNNTFVDNTATDIMSGELGGAIAYLPYSNRLVIANNVMAFNSSGISRRSGATLSATILDNDMWNGTHDYVNQAAGPGDVHLDPQFVDRAAANYRLTAASPAVDEGNNTYARPATDLDGVPRVQDGHGSGTPVVDMGAFEYSPDFDGDGSPDWIDPDDDGDGAPDVQDCAPHDASVWAAPVEVAGVLVTRRGPVSLAWAAPVAAAHIDIAAGSTAAVRQQGGFGAMAWRAQDVTAATWSDDQAGPPSGDARLYLLRQHNGCGTGTWGTASDGTPRALPACP